MRVSRWGVQIFEFGKPNKLNQLSQLNQPNKHSELEVVSNESYHQAVTAGIPTGNVP